MESSSVGSAAAASPQDPHQSVITPEFGAEVMLWALGNNPGEGTAWAAVGELRVRHPGFDSLSRNPRAIRAGRDLQGHPVPPRPCRDREGSSGTWGSQKGLAGTGISLEKRLWSLGHPIPGPGSKTRGAGVLEPGLSVAAPAAGTLLKALKAIERHPWCSQESRICGIKAAPLPPPGHCSELAPAWAPAHPQNTQRARRCQAQRDITPVPYKQQAENLLLTLKSAG